MLSQLHNEKIRKISENVESSDLSPKVFMRTIRASELHEDLTIYPRAAVDQFNVDRLVDALKSGAKLPPLIIESATYRIVDGFHRRRAYIVVYGPDAEIECVERSYGSESELFLDAVRLNAGHGAALAGIDRKHCAAIAARLSIPDELVAGALSIPKGRIGALKPAAVTTNIAALEVPKTQGQSNGFSRMSLNHKQNPHVPKAEPLIVKPAASSAAIEIVERLISLFESRQIDAKDTALVAKLFKLSDLIKAALTDSEIEEIRGPPPFQDAVDAVDWVHREKLVVWYLEQKGRKFAKLTDDEIEELTRIVMLRMFYQIGHKGKPDSTTFWCKTCQWAVQEKSSRRTSTGGLATISVKTKQLKGVDTEDDSDLLATMFGKEDESVSEFERVEDAKATLERALACLTDRERGIVMQYYGERKTMDQIGEPLGITRGRVQQIIAAACDKIRAGGFSLEDTGE